MIGEIMTSCNMCGSDVGKMYVISLEGSDLKVCKACSLFGKVKEIVMPVMKKEKKKNVESVAKVKLKPEKEIIQMIIPNFSNIVKNARERKGLKQKEVAKLINEKESVIHKIESGTFKPSIKLAEKLERFFRIDLIQEHEEIHHAIEAKGNSEGLTIGDMIKVRKKS